jgi:hypothetical protein
VTTAHVVPMDEHASHLEKLYQEVVDSHTSGPAPEHDVRDLLLHQYRQVVRRDDAIDWLHRLVADLRAEREADQGEMEAERARLLQTASAFGEERDWWRARAQRLAEELAQVEGSAVVKLARFLGAFRSRRSLPSGPSS